MILNDFNWQILNDDANSYNISVNPNKLNIKEYLKTTQSKKYL